MEFFLGGIPFNKGVLVATNSTLMTVITTVNIQLSDLRLEWSVHSAIVLSMMFLAELLTNWLGGLLWVLNEHPSIVLCVSRHFVAFDLRIGEKQRKSGRSPGEQKSRKWGICRL